MYVFIICIHHSSLRKLADEVQVYGIRDVSSNSRLFKERNIHNIYECMGLESIMYNNMYARDSISGNLYMRCLHDLMLITLYLYFVRFFDKYILWSIPVISVHMIIYYLSYFYLFVKLLKGAIKLYCRYIIIILCCWRNSKQNASGIRVLTECLMCSSQFKKVVLKCSSLHNIQIKE